jgi:hypothetical protein
VVSTTKKLEINPTTEFHVLRHFQDVSAEYKHSLIAKSYHFFNHTFGKFESSVINELLIEHALQTIGGKFNLSTSKYTNPIDILELCQVQMAKLGTLEWIENGANKEANFQVECDDFIGTENIILEKELPFKECQKVEVKYRSLLPGEDKIFVKTLSGYQTKLTNKIDFHLVDTPLLPFLWVSAFPVNNIKIDLENDFWSQVVVII